MDQKQSRRRAWKDKLKTLGRRSKSIPTSRDDNPSKFEIIPGIPISFIENSQICAKLFFFRQIDCLLLTGM